MSDEPKFVAKIVNNLPVKNNSGKGQLDEFLHSKKVFSKIKDVAPTIPTIDISVSTDVFKQSVQKVMDEEPLTNHFFLFSSRRRSEKIRLERDRVNDLLSIIDRAIETNRNIIRYNVDVFITQQTLERLALEHVVNLEKYARAILREEELLARLHIDNLDKVDDEKTLRKIQIKKLELENAILEAQTDEARTKVDFIKNILSQVNVKDMPATLQAYITTSIINPNGTQFNDFDMQQQIKEYVIRKERAETIEKESQAEVAKKTAEKTVFDLDTIRRGTKS